MSPRGLVYYLERHTLWFHWPQCRGENERVKGFGSAVALAHERSSAYKFMGRRATRA